MRSRLQPFERDCPHDDFFLTEALCQLLAVTAPPVAIQRFAHDLEADDLIPADDAGFVGPMSDRRRSQESGHATEALRQLAADPVELIVRDALAVVVGNRKEELDQEHEPPASAAS